MVAAMGTGIILVMVARVVLVALIMAMAALATLMVVIRDNELFFRIAPCTKIVQITLLKIMNGILTATK